MGGTAWLWASDKLAQSVERPRHRRGRPVLAGQRGRRVGRNAESLVLLGDPQQLDQPTQGTHPPGAGRSALAHLLGERPRCPATWDCSWSARGDCIRTSAPTRQRSSTRASWSRRTATRSRGSPVSRLLMAQVSASWPWTTWLSEMTLIRPRRLRSWRRSSADSSRPGRPGRTTRGRRAPCDRRTSSSSRPSTCIGAASGPPWRRRGGGRTCAGRHRGQVPGPAGAHLHLLDGHLPAGGCAPRPGVPLLAQPPQRGHLAGTLPDRGRASPALVLVDAKTPRQMELANALCRFVEVAGDGGGPARPPDTVVPSRAEGES